MHEHRGGCHCGNLRITLRTRRPPGELQPRACDCTFCRKHRAAWVSDPAGKLHVRVGDAARLSRYSQGSGSAQLLICSACGVLVAAVYQGEERLYGTVNAWALEASEELGEPVPVSPQRLSAPEKRARWQTLWFADVSVQVEAQVGSSTGRPSG